MQNARNEIYEQLVCPSCPCDLSYFLLGQDLLGHSKISNLTSVLIVFVLLLNNNYLLVLLKVVGRNHFLTGIHATAHAPR